MNRKIVLPPPVNPELFQELKSALGIRDVFVELLIQRGIHTFDEARAFFRPSEDQLHDPFLMKDMHRAVQRIEKALETGEKILVYGDYDVDGTTAVAAFYSFLRDKLHHPELAYYIPDRYTEGYGVSFRGIEFAKENGFTLIVALDCGVKSVDKIAKAKSYGIDFIVCDHHLPGDELPDTVAMLNPKQADCPYPYKELSGCGIGLKLMTALCMKRSLPFDWAYEYLDLAAISACADIVPLTGENRIITALGLKRIQSTMRPGIAALLEKAQFLHKSPEVEDVVFVIAPRINAAGRLKHGKSAVELLIAAPGELADFNAELLNTQNKDRRELDKLITAEALSLIEKDSDYIHKKSTVVFQPHWHKGVVGIVASRLIETHYRPTVVLTESNGKVTGSARSVKGFDLYAAMEACADLFDNFGGHMHAAGVTMPPEHVEPFKIRFEQAVAERITEEQRIPVVEADARFPLSELNESFFNLLRQFAPFGPGNMNPVFISEPLAIYNQGLRIVGENHLQMQVWNATAGSTAFKAIAFKQAHRYPQIENAPHFQLCYSVRENVFAPSEDRIFKSLDLDVKEIMI
ncbi:MAG: single-stranded-DNA-specific exonuclease RecJ [Flavobacteriales bacterium]|nr:single-stranded-DNA-specific exonuclease RecJ [Flavobacteriales bacterium]